MGKKFCFSLLLLFAVTFTVADSLFGFFSPYGETVTVPNFEGRLDSEISLPFWAEPETVYQYHPDAPVGTVLQQSPPPESRVKIPTNGKRRLTLTVSLGAERVSVPDVVGQDARTASAILRELGFSVTQQPVEGGTAGMVVNVLPTVGSSLEAGTEVVLSVSQGTPTKTVTVPNLIGLSRSMALIELFRYDLSVGTVTEEPSDSPSGTVIRQSPSAGSLVAPQTRLNLTVSQEKLPSEEISE